MENKTQVSVESVPGDTIQSEPEEEKCPSCDGVKDMWGLRVCSGCYYTVSDAIGKAQQKQSNDDDPLEVSSEAFGILTAATT